MSFSRAQPNPCASLNTYLLRSCEAADLRRLLRATLRLRPDHVLVGEDAGRRSARSLENLVLGPSGRRRHASRQRARSGLTRPLENLVAEATSAPAQRTIAEAIHLIVCIAKTKRGRRVQELVRVRGFDGTPLPNRTRGALIMPASFFLPRSTLFWALLLVSIILLPPSFAHAASTGDLGL